MLKELGRELSREIKGLGYTHFGFFKDEFRIKEELTVDGLGLTLSSHTKEVNQTIDRMRATLKKRGAREGKEPEAPTRILMSKPNKKGVSKFEFEYHEQKYILEGKPDLEEFSNWITDYTQKAESCITCDRILFPGQPVGYSDGRGLMHMASDCCPSGGFYAGHIDENGKLKPLTEKDYQVIG